MVLQSGMIWMRDINTEVSNHTVIRTEDAPQFRVIVNMARV
jgi:hypothetical protein